MNYEASPLAVGIFVAFIVIVLFISYRFARRTKSSEQYFAAGGTVHWSVNGIAFAGDYLSAASFLGICGLIAMYGYDGFLYSIGYLGGWIVALFIIAEPMKRMGKFTFTDALDSKFDSKGIKLVGAISTLVVSVFYLIPQMVGAGTLITPLLGAPYEAGVVIVGAIVIVIVATAGMSSTTYVQFLKGSLLIVFTLILVLLLLGRGFSTAPDQGGQVQFHQPVTIGVTGMADDTVSVADSSYTVEKTFHKQDMTFIELSKAGEMTIWKLNEQDKVLEETQTVTKLADGTELYNGAPKEEGKFYQVGNMSVIDGSTDVENKPVDILSFFETIKTGTVDLWKTTTIADGDSTITVYYQQPTDGVDILGPGQEYKVDPANGATLTDQLNFVSLMLALFLGTAALPHILIRYFTVKNPASARKSTIVAIIAIGVFYILTLYVGLGAMTSGVLDMTNNNMSAPLLAKSFGVAIFAVISAIAFATILGTVSGLLVASSGAIAHDVLDRYMDKKLSEKKKVNAGKITALVVGCFAILLGILFKGMNVSFLVGWAFAVAASANLPSIIMLLFWKKTTAKGIIASITVGLISSITLILLSQDTFNKVYHLVNVTAPVQINNPAIFSVPLSFVVLILVSLFAKGESAKGIKVKNIIGAD